jgi:endonuclease/exonuclease/phosphatase (EEP) superfamily protein YafD
LRAVLERLGAGLAALPLKLVRATVLLAAFASALLSLAAAGGRIIPLLDVASHFALLGMIVSSIALVVALLVSPKDDRSPIYLALLGIACWAALLAPDYIIALTSNRSPQGGQTVKVIQFNVWESNQNRDGTLDWILRQDPDILVLEEVTDRTFWMTQALRERYPFAHGCADPSPCGTMILTKSEPLSSGGSPFSSVAAYLA